MKISLAAFLLLLNVTYAQDPRVEIEQSVSSSRIGNLTFAVPYKKVEQQNAIGLGELAHPGELTNLKIPAEHEDGIRRELGFPPSFFLNSIEIQKLSPLKTISQKNQFWYVVHFDVLPQGVTGTTGELAQYAIVADSRSKLVPADRYLHSSVRLVQRSERSVQLETIVKLPENKTVEAASDSSGSELSRIASESLALALKSAGINLVNESLKFTEVGTVKIGESTLRFAALKTKDNSDSLKFYFVDTGKSTIYVSDYVSD